MHSIVPHANQANHDLLREQQTLWDDAPSAARSSQALAAAKRFPRLRYMGSKYVVLPHLLGVFSELEFSTALDAFSGSGVVAYALKSLGKRVTANDFMHFASSVAKATVENPGIRLDSSDIETITGPALDDRDFIRSTFRGLYFSEEDHAFLDSAWSHIDRLPEYKREIALSSLCLSAARKQPRGVFTVTDQRYDDGRRYIRLPLKEHFLLAATEYNAAIQLGGPQCKSTWSNVLDLEPNGFDLVYFDPPYAPPRDDADYMKRYHFLEGLSLYWRGVKIMEHTATKKIEKKFTPFAYKRTIETAFRDLFHQFSESIIVLSYNSQSVPGKDEIFRLLREVKPQVDCYEIPHTYHFGTHSTARRRQAREFIFVAR
jgi:adenine-specific DNA-methyltransferase